jgi:hypothetical protein
MEGVVFGSVLIAIFFLRAIIATIVFFWILPGDGRCPNCDTETLRLESRGLLRILPWLRPSWCFECEWRGLLRSNGRLPSHTAAAIPASFHSIRKSHQST